MARVSASLLAAGIAAATLLTTAPAYAVAPPTPVTGLATHPGDSQVTLSWTNPADLTDFAGVTVVQKAGETAPSAIADGETRYEGTGTSTVVTGLTNGATYSFAVFTRNTAGDVSEPATAPPVAPVPALLTKLTATVAPGLVTYGTSVVITARLTRSDTGAAIANQPVDFYRRQPGESAFTKIGRIVTNADGVVAHRRLAPDRNAQWYAVHPANPYIGGSQSNTVTSLVRPKLATRVSAYVVEQGVTSVVTVQVLPAHPGHAVVMQIATPDGWKDFAARRLSTASTARWDLRTYTMGTRTFRLVKAADYDSAPGVTAPFGITVVRRTLRSGMSGGDVLNVQKRLSALHYDVGTVNGYFGYDTVHATYAFQKVHGLPRTGAVDARTYDRILHPSAPRLRYSHGGSWVEADLTKQVLYYVRNGAIQRILDISSGNGEVFYVDGDREVAATPTGNFSVLRKIDGWRISRLGSLWRPAYFAAGGFAIHGAPSVPPYPASHGCIRITIPAMNRLYSSLTLGLPVHVYRS
ncbi:MAG TPA: L,D-transpeptidase family protein [Mycobacteriales bacterium]|jgi:peptidoglycan hydrolase-like protein with peptidoglycan-binding domain